MENTKKICPCCGKDNLTIIPPEQTLIKISASDDAKNGYAICQSCGRSLSITTDGEIIKRPWQKKEDNMDKKELEKLRKNILKLYKQKDAIIKELEEKTGVLRENCGHDSIIECDYQPETALFYAQPPARRCIICGLVENGWGCGYQKLTKSPIKIISREEFYKGVHRLPELKTVVVQLIE